MTTAATSALQPAAAGTGAVSTAPQVGGGKAGTNVQYGPNLGGSTGLSYAPLAEIPGDFSYELKQDARQGVSAAAAEAASRRKAAEDLAADLASSAPASPKGFSQNHTGTKALETDLASKYFAQSFAAMDAAEKAEFWRFFPGVAELKAIRPDKARAASCSLAVATAVTYLDKPNFFLAFAAASQALDPDSSVAANNFASAIITAGERLNPLPKGQSVEGASRTAALAPFRADAETAYRYAVLASLEHDAYTEASIKPLMNLGYLLVDGKDISQAKGCFLAVKSLTPSSWDAAKGLGACYFAGGRKDLTKAVLEEESTDKSALWTASFEDSKNITALEPTIEIPADSSDDTYQKAIDEFPSLKLATSADFVEGLDPGDRDRFRNYLENLPPKGTYAVPPITMVAQFSSLIAMHEPAGISALKDFSESIAGYFIKNTALSNVTQQLAMAKNMGVNVNLGFDPADMAAHPEKYKNFKPNVSVSGADETANRMDSLAASARSDLAAGKTGSTLAMAAAVDPFFNILRLNPSDYADPFNIIVQKQNFTIYQDKFHTYSDYLYAVNKRTNRTITDIVSQVKSRLTSIVELENQELAELQAKYELARKLGALFSEADWKLRFHAIHVANFNQYNTIMEVAWNQATEAAATNYLKKIKPTAEAFYYDVIRHIALISDPEVRQSKEMELRRTIDQAVAYALQNVLAAFGGFNYKDKWDCGCNIEALMAQRAEEQQALDKEEDERVARNKAAKKRFDSGDIPESSALFKRLDSYAADLSIPFIPFLSGRISEARTVVKFSVNLPIPGLPGLSGGFSENNFTGATTYNGGVSVNFGAQEGDVKIGAKFSLDGSVSTDGTGVVSDYNMTAGTTLGFSGAAGRIGVGGSMSVTPKGPELSANATATLNNGISSGTLSVEGSTARGCTVSGQVDQTLQPAQEFLDSASKENLGKDYAGASPSKDFLKKSLWSGKYTF